MSEEKTERISKVARELNIGVQRAIDFLNSKGAGLRNDPNAKISEDYIRLLKREFGEDLKDKKEASNLTIGKKAADNFVIDSQKPTTHYAKKQEEEVFIRNTQPDVKPSVNEPEPELIHRTQVKLDGPKILGKINLEPQKPAVKPQTSVIEEPKPAEQEPKNDYKQEAQTTKKQESVTETHVTPESVDTPTPPELPEEESNTELIEAKAETLKGLTVLGKIELTPEKPKSSEPFKRDDKNDKKKRKRIKIDKPAAQAPVFNKPKDHTGKGNPFKDNKSKQVPKEEITDKQIQEQIRNTLARLSGNKPTVNRAKYRKDKRTALAEAEEERLLQEQEDANILKVTEFISANDLASMMDVPVTQIISACMSLGLFVSINQRLDAETISIIAEEFGYKAQFITAEEEISVEEDEDAEDDLVTRPPIVTIMGHVDHGKTSLLDYIRKTNVTAGEAGGITQHIGAYDVVTEGGKKITFLDTPGHEAFTAMRARGAKVTDIVIIVVAADDGVMPQTKEALNHALNAGVPIVIAINKIDKPAANPDKIKEQLANENILVEDWGGKYQCEGISAKTGKGIPDLLEKVLLEAEILDLKANPNKKASGTVIEAELDKGRGYVTTILVQTGTLRQGNVILAGQHYGKVRAMYDHLGKKLKEAGPSKPVQILGLSGAPQAGDKFNVMDTDAEAREIANKREQILREQNMRTKKHITLDEIGRRLAIGNFKQLNVIVKGDVDGSVEALTDSLLKLSTNEIQVSVIHKGVGQISESDVLLASAADAIIVAFQVRPSQGARKLAEQEEIEIRMYSIIYDAINDIKDAMEGMLAPEFVENIMGTAEVREVFKISKVGTIAGCMVIDGHIKRQAELRVIRGGIVVHSGKFASLKRFKDDVSEVKQSMDCGIGIHNYNDIQIGDLIEAFEKKEVKRKL